MDQSVEIDANQVGATSDQSVEIDLNELDVKVKTIRGLIAELTPLQVRAHFYHTYGFEPPADLNSFSKLEKFAKIFGREPITDDEVIAAMVKADKFGLHRMVRVLAERVTPERLRTYFDRITESKYVPDVDLRTFSDLKKLLFVLDATCDCGAPNCTPKLRLGRAATEGYTNMFNFMLGELIEKEGIEKIRSALNHAYVEAAENNRFDIVRKCIEFGANDHDDALRRCNRKNNQEMISLICQICPDARNAYGDSDDSACEEGSPTPITVSELMKMLFNS